MDGDAAGTTLMARVAAAAASVAVRRDDPPGSAEAMLLRRLTRERMLARDTANPDAAPEPAERRRDGA
jgi:hypothetical protein